MKLHSPHYSFAKGHTWCTIAMQTGPNKYLAMMATSWKHDSDRESTATSKKKRVAHDQRIIAAEGRRCRFVGKNFSSMKKRCKNNSTTAWSQIRWLLQSPNRGRISAEDCTLLLPSAQRWRCCRWRN
ncbi:hypothetical protein MUK42_32568 [Musa troglodytarum]|uniref:Uncharacterized protein n=1 Tax=Musa troglodytarum TaxID=320322 RepID=A0A9E7F430_9LILI|nr:hypothetical protein MUK42_32568 [Musa troglodytarum]